MGFQTRKHKGGKLPPPPKIRCQCSPDCHRSVIAGNTFCAYHEKNGCPIKPHLSEAEPVWDPDTYNKDKAKKHSHNCFAFAFQVHDVKKIEECRYKNKCGFHVPGKTKGHPDFSGKMGKTCSDVLARTMADVRDAYLTDFSTRCKPGFSKLAVIVDNKRDFHYVPQFKEIYVDELKKPVKGLFGHKPGGRDATMRDGAGAPIYRPDLAYWYYPKESEIDEGLYYDSFCSYMCAPRGDPPKLAGGKQTCLEVKDKKYQTRKSPPFHAGDCKGQEKKGKDGLYVSVADKKNVYKWVKKTLKKRKGVKTYVIQDNMSEPFLVEDTGSKVNVYKQNYDKDLDKYILGDLIMTDPYKKIWIGDNDLKDPHYDKKGGWKGNSILLKLPGPGYKYIGESIFTFQPEDVIEKYYSPMGNSGVPYPSAVGKKYTYLMIENVYIPNDVLDLKVDAYQQYYGFGEKYKDVKKHAKAFKKKTIVKRN
jgi:hypothetical protein